MRDIDEGQPLDAEIDPQEVLTLAEAVGIPESGGIQALRWYLRGERIHRTQQRDQQAHRFALMAQQSAVLVAHAFSQGVWSRQGLRNDSL